MKQLAALMTISLMLLGALPASAVTAEQVHLREIQECFDKVKQDRPRWRTKTLADFQRAFDRKPKYWRKYCSQDTDNK